MNSKNDRKLPEIDVEALERERGLLSDQVNSLRQREDAAVSWVKRNGFKEKRFAAQNRLDEIDKLLKQDQQRKEQETDDPTFDVKAFVAERSGTSAADWEFFDGPETGVGTEYWLASEADSLEAYVCIDQGEVVSCEINETKSNSDDRKLPKTSGEFPVLFEIDPTSNEATGTVMPFCSTACRDACGGTAYPGFRMAKEGTSTLSDFGYDPQCEECGGDIKSIAGLSDERKPVDSSTANNWRVMLHEAPGDKVQLVFDCFADDADHAAEQAEGAYPGCEVISTTQLEDIEQRELQDAVVKAAVGDEVIVNVGVGPSRTILAVIEREANELGLYTARVAQESRKIFDRETVLFYVQQISSVVRSKPEIQPGM
ncbi:hypothetical protein [Paraburkholderia sp. J8-2]|uniref:hypothetical protein n=1 Tax=Paraburkholderia sp. J8-2 TaxID=2805440 RepID=UPI002AB791FB|nr:hypothetical protein [Paraburkholderia sp. J8-2]